MATIPNPSGATRLLLTFTALALAAASSARAQAYTPPPPKLTPGPCIPTKEFPCTPLPAAPAIPAPADKFPFPGENPGTPDPSAPAAAPSNAASPSAAPSNAAPAAGTPPASAPATPANSAAGQFPFPGESPDLPSIPGSSSSAPDSGSSSSSSSSTDGFSSSSDPNAPAPAEADKSPLNDAGSTGSTRFARRKLAAPEDNDHRELEDIEVAHFYIDSGNFSGAYVRAQDAVKLYPGDENAHFVLAAAAEKLKKRDEAVAEYHAYLALAPDGKEAKAAHHALEDLEPNASPKSGKK